MPPAKKKVAAKKKAAAKKRVAANKADNVFAFVGTDEGRVRQAAHDCFTRKSNGLDEFGAEVIDGTAENSEDASRIIGRTIEALLTMPFFGGNKVVWLKNANFVADNLTGNSSKTQTALEGITTQLTAGLPMEVTFILSATAIDKRRSFYKRLSAIATVESFDKPDTSRVGWEQAVMAYVSAEASQRGLRFQRQALDLFTNLIGAETQQVDQELEKLDLYLGDRRDVTEEDIRQVVSLSRGGVVFEIGNALSKRQLSRVLSLTDHLLYRGETAVGILLAAIVPQVRRLLQAKDLLHRFRIQANNYQEFERQLARLPAEEVAHLPTKKDGTPNTYPIFLSAKEASNFHVDELRRGLEACLEANLRLVTTGLDSKVVLNQLVIQLLTPSKRS